MDLIRKKDRILVFLGSADLTSQGLPSVLADVCQEKSERIVLHLADVDDLKMDALSVMAVFSHDLKEKGIQVELVATAPLKDRLHSCSCDELFSEVRTAS